MMSFNCPDSAFLNNVSRKTAFSGISLVKYLRKRLVSTNTLFIGNSPGDLLFHDFSDCFGGLSCLRRHRTAKRLNRFDRFDDQGVIPLYEDNFVVDVQMQRIAQFLGYGDLTFLGDGGCEHNCCPVFYRSITFLEK